MPDLPRKAVTRTARLASLPLGYAGRTALGMGKRLGGAPAEAVMTEVQQRTAEQLFRTLGELKGGAMKFGQALSILEGALPEEMAAPYRAHLTKLQDSAPPMSTAVVHQQLVREFGAGWKRKIVEFDDLPAAAASIGQVHRGRWVDGTDVAIKIQYPGAEQAMISDLRQITRLAKTFGGLVPGIDARALAQELQDRIVEELDYRLEAEAQAAFAEAFADDTHFVVPRPVAHAQRVLVTRVAAGDQLAGQGHRGRQPRGARPLGDALRAVHVRGPRAHRHDARRPASGELPHRPRRRRRPGPAGRARLRRGLPAARPASCRGHWAG